MVPAKDKDLLLKLAYFRNYLPIELLEVLVARKREEMVPYLLGFGKVGPLANCLVDLEKLSVVFFDGAYYVVDAFRCVVVVRVHL